MIINKDCLIALKEIPENSVDSIVTDPPYELGFMGKSWDNTGIANNVELWKECLRVLKPGGHLLAFSGTRTYHRMASAIEDAGFEVRDMVEWVYGSGFPKSLNIGKVMDKFLKTGNASWNGTGDSTNGALGYSKLQNDQGYRPADYSNRHQNTSEITENKAKEWEGWGTALKPAHEPICMARKPLAEKSVALNVLKYGTGGINIDGSRVEAQGETMSRPFNEINEENVWNSDNSGYKKRGNPNNISDQLGRFPANLIHDNSEEVRECFPDSKAGSYKGEGSKSGGIWSESTGKPAGMEYGDSGNASRFFKSVEQDSNNGEYKSLIYQAKASKSERNKGCEGLIDKKAPKLKSISNFCIKCGKREDYKCNCNVGFEYKEQPNYQNITKNNHPTVKPIALMEYLIKMVTPKGGTVLDPFAGSGSTLVAAKQNDYKFIGIEREAEYVKIIEARLNIKNDKLF